MALGLSKLSTPFPKPFKQKLDHSDLEILQVDGLVLSSRTLKKDAIG